MPQQSSIFIDSDRVFDPKFPTKTINSSEPFYDINNGRYIKCNSSLVNDEFSVKDNLNSNLLESASFECINNNFSVTPSSSISSNSESRLHLMSSPTFYSHSINGNSNVKCSKHIVNNIIPSPNISDTGSVYDNDSLLSQSVVDSDGSIINNELQSSRLNLWSPSSSEQAHANTYTESTLSIRKSISNFIDNRSNKHNNGEGRIYEKTHTFNQFDNKTHNYNNNHQQYQNKSNKCEARVNNGGYVNFNNFQSLDESNNTPNNNNKNDKKSNNDNRYNSNLGNSNYNNHSKNHNHGNNGSHNNNYNPHNNHHNHQNNSQQQNQPVATNTLHVAYRPSVTDRGELYMHFRTYPGFELFAFYDHFCFVRFITDDYARHALTLPAPVGVITLEAAKQRYRIPYPQPDDDNLPAKVLHITHLPNNYTREEMLKVFNGFKGFVLASFHGKYAYVQFDSEESAAEIWTILRTSTNLVISYARNMVRADDHVGNSGLNTDDLVSSSSSFSSSSQSTGHHNNSINHYYNHHNTGIVHYNQQYNKNVTSPILSGGSSRYNHNSNRITSPNMYMQHGNTNNSNVKHYIHKYDLNSSNISSNNQSHYGIGGSGSPYISERAQNAILYNQQQAQLSLLQQSYSSDINHNIDLESYLSQSLQLHNTNSNHKSDTASRVSNSSSNLRSNNSTQNAYQLADYAYNHAQNETSDRLTNQNTGGSSNYANSSSPSSSFYNISSESISRNQVSGYRTSNDYSHAINNSTNYYNQNVESRFSSYSPNSSNISDFKMNNNHRNMINLANDNRADGLGINVNSQPYAQNGLQRQYQQSQANNINAINNNGRHNSISLSSPISHLSNYSGASHHSQLLDTTNSIGNFTYIPTNGNGSSINNNSNSNTELTSANASNNESTKEMDEQFINDFDKLFRDI